jgi:hypothetical protein
MIVYFEKETGSILGLSYKVVPGRNESYFETTDPIAEKIFNGTEKVSKYRAELRSTDSKKGFLIPRSSSTSKFILASNRYHLISKKLSDTEVKVYQNINDKTITVTIDKAALEWWSKDLVYSKKRLFLVACNDDTPFIPLWIKSISVEEFTDCSYKFSYTGKSEFFLFTDKFFESYAHEIKSS